MMSQAKVLIVDDEKLVLEAYSRELSAKGFSVKVSNSPAEALELVAKEPFDIVFIDLVMPQMNGVEACKKIIQIRPESEVILISGHPRQVEEHLYDFVAAGGRDEQLRKPLMRDELVETAERVWQELLERKEKR